VDHLFNFFSQFYWIYIFKSLVFFHINKLKKITMKNIDRRNFLKQAMIGFGMLSGPMKTNDMSEQNSTNKVFTAHDRIVLGKTGIETSRLALGSGTIGGGKQSNQTRLGMEKFISLIRHGYERGITFWDSADQYGSHPHFKEALKYISREKVVIMTKSSSHDTVNMKKDIERFRKELGTDYIDIILLHCMIDDNWTKTMNGAMEVLSEAKESGIIRAYGASCHSLGALKSAVKSPWTDVILARINHAGSNMDSEPGKVIPILKEGNISGKSILGMKILGEGDLRNQIDKSIHFVLNLEFVEAITIGFESTKELDEVIKNISEV
jgi:predicted aldo/keto reductase-like oxidoreductase